MSVCINCGTELVETYCHHCGQKKNSRRLNMRDVVSDIASSNFWLESPILKTMKELSLHPGNFCREFIAGKRISKYKPVQYFALITFIYFLLYFWFDVDKLYLEKIVQDHPNYVETYNTEKQKAWEILTEFISTFLDENRKYWDVLSIFVFAFITQMFFRKSGYNYTENLTVAIYLKTHSYIIETVFLFFVPVGGLFIFKMSGFVALIYIAWGLAQFFQQSLLKGMFKVVFAILTALFLTLILALIVMMFYVFYSIGKI